MRLFIAIPIPENVKSYIESIQYTFKDFNLRFTKPQQMHITIDFLGEIPDEKVNGIICDLSRIRFQKFNIKLNSLGSFPARDTIRVIWIGIENNEQFMELQKSVRKIFRHKGKFMPHLTIARAKRLMHDERLTHEITDYAIQPQEFLVDKFVLYKSEFQKDGVIHSVVKEFVA